jgi:hypothetical protein
MSEPTWWLYGGVPNAKEAVQLIEILGAENFHFGHKQPNNNPNAAFWPYLDVDKSVSDSKKLLVEILLHDKIVKDWINCY